MSKNGNLIHFPDGAAWTLKDGQRVPVKTIAAQNDCNCKIDCCLKAILLQDHGDATLNKYIYLVNGVLEVGTEAELKAISTIL